MSGDATPTVRKSARQPQPKIHFDDIDSAQEIHQKAKAASRRARMLDYHKRMKQAAKEKANAEERATTSSLSSSKNPNTLEKTVKEEIPEGSAKQNVPNGTVKEEPPEEPMNFKASDGAVIRNVVKEPVEEVVDQHDLTIKEVIANMMKVQREEAANMIAQARQAHDLKRAHQRLMSSKQFQKEQEKAARAAAIRESNRQYQLLARDTAIIRRVDPKIAIHTGLRHTFAGTTKYATDYNVQPGVPQHPLVLPVKVVQENAINSRTEIPAVGRRNPINHRMVKPEDIVTSYQNHHVVQPGELAAGSTYEEKVKNTTLARHTFEKIERNDPTVYQHIMSSSMLPTSNDPHRGAASLATRPVPGSNREVGLPEVSMVRADVDNVVDRNSKRKQNPSARSILFNIDERLPLDVKNYEGVPGAGRVPSYEEDRLTTTNPTLAKKLSKAFGYPYPLKVQQCYEERMGLDELVARKAEYDRQKALGGGEIIFPNYSTFFKPSAPPERKTYCTSTVSVSRIPEILDDSPVQVVYNGNQSEIPGEIYCHLCHSAMRLCMRKSKYRGELREYPAYRCLRKGCQTFRSVRKIMKPESESPASKAPGTPSVSYRSLLDTDVILGSLMLMPDSKARQLERGPVKQEGSDVNDQSQLSKNEVKEEVMDVDEDESWRGPNRLDEMLNSNMDYDEEEEQIVKPEPEDDYGVPNSNTVDDGEDDH